MAVKRFGQEVTGVCKICGEQGKTEMHHIISKWRYIQIKRKELINSSGNIIELCGDCHSQTTSSLLARSDKVIYSDDWNEFDAQCAIIRRQGFVAIGEPEHIIETDYQYKVDIFDENDVGELREVKSEYWTQTWTPKNSLKARIFRGDKLSDKKPNWENPI